MKKIIAMLAALMLCLSFCLAETEEAPVDTYFFLVPAIEGSEVTEAQIAMDADFGAVLALIGEPVGYFESVSCAFQGMDKVYTYPSFVVNTYPKDGADMVASIYLMDDMFTTAEGAYIGMHMDEVKAIYGEPTSAAESSISFEKDGCMLSFLCDADGYVNGITYVSVAASAQ